MSSIYRLPDLSQRRHGLSYTTFEYSQLELSKPEVSNGDLNVTASVSVKNSGNLPGSEIVQLYVTMPTTSDLSHAPLMLKRFAKIRDLQPGRTQRIKLQLDKYAVSYWEERISRWVVERGEYSIKVGPSSDRLPLEGSFRLTSGFEWTGL